MSPGEWVGRNDLGIDAGPATHAIEFEAAERAMVKGRWSAIAEIEVDTYRRPGTEPSTD